MIYLIDQLAAENELKTDITIIKDLIEDSVYHQYIRFDAEKMMFLLEAGCFAPVSDRIIPIGSIEFVENWLNHYHNIDHICPMEIPKCLQRPHFLKREYKIVPYSQLPSEGNWFIKDVSRLKSFVGVGNKNTLSTDGQMDKTHWYQCSEYVSDIKAEYRLYFIDGKLENVCHYNGDPTCRLAFDLVLTADSIFRLQDDYPRSYTMDVMVTDKGTSLIELHPFVSIGLYSTLWGQNLLGAYMDGIRYVKKWNSPCYLTNER